MRCPCFRRSGNALQWTTRCPAVYRGAPLYSTWNIVVGGISPAASLEEVLGEFARAADARLRATGVGEAALVEVVPQPPSLRPHHTTTAARCANIFVRVASMGGRRGLRKSKGAATCNKQKQRLVIVCWPLSSPTLVGTLQARLERLSQPSLEVPSGLQVSLLSNYCLLRAKEATGAQTMQVARLAAGATSNTCHCMDARARTRGTVWRKTKVFLYESWSTRGAWRKDLSQTRRLSTFPAHSLEHCRPRLIPFCCPTLSCMWVYLAPVPKPPIQAPEVTS